MIEGISTIGTMASEKTILQGGEKKVRITNVNGCTNINKYLTATLKNNWVDALNKYRRMLTRR